MGDFRARDADRDRTVEVIESAYVDGQLGEADRELRVSRALTAETLDELAMITRDLQVPPGSQPIVEPRAPATAHVRPRSGSPRPARALLAVLLLALPAAVMFGLVVFLSTGGSESVGSVESTEVERPAETEEPVQEAVGFELSPRDVRGFVRAYEEQFGTLEAVEAGFYPDWAGVQVPVRGTRPRMERWTWDGTWTQDAGVEAVRGGDGLVDLGAIDVRRLFANIDDARRTLAVDDGEVTHVLFNRRFDDRASVYVYVGNEFDESGFLKTTPAGEVLARHPYQP